MECVFFFIIVSVEYQLDRKITRYLFIMIICQICKGNTLFGSEALIKLIDALNTSIPDLTSKTCYSYILNLIDSRMNIFEQIDNLENEIYEIEEILDNPKLNSDECELCSKIEAIRGEINEIEKEFTSKEESITTLKKMRHNFISVCYSYILVTIIVTFVGFI